ncbi:MAG TPA: helix-turn-helix transcriptional regulator, partial [Mycobacterium sp.]|uniref:helix-turn-helix transcriptional regulator n=1 Tax=Mycobacterium sp. TaxID=1785 RepID=UPI002D5F184F
MVAVDEFSRLVSGIYAAAVTPQHWEPALHEIRRALGGAVGSLTGEAANGMWQIQATTAPPDVPKTYAEHYYRLDYVLAGLKNGPVGAVRTGTELVAPGTNTEFYNDWMRPNDFGDGLFVSMTDGQRLSCLIVTSPRRTESFDTPDRVKLMGALIPHLQQAMRTQSKLTALADRTAELASALNAVRHGIVLVGSECWVLDLNAAAEAILRTHDGVHVYAGRLGAENRLTERKLYRALHAALVGDSSDTRSGRSLICERPSGKRPYVIHVLPLQRTSSDEIPTDTRALVLITDPE